MRIPAAWCKLNATGKVRLTETLELLAQLYDDWGKPEEAADVGHRAGRGLTSSVPRAVLGCASR